MKITWTITKKRGNSRPFCDWKMEKTQEEVDLRIGKIVFVKTPFPQFTSLADTCFDGQDERGDKWNPQKFAEIETPPSEKSLTEGRSKLPWKPGASPSYPEVEEFFRHVQAEYDKAFHSAFASGPIEESWSLDHTETIKKAIAPTVAARKMLNK